MTLSANHLDCSYRNLLWIETLDFDDQIHGLSHMYALSGFSISSNAVIVRG